MLTHLSIKNYALIDELDVAFNTPFASITGETGAGKSILLGGLSLVLGKRADISQVKNTQKKCVIEANFKIEPYNLKSIFESLDLDYDSQTIIRREILPSGKSRAFVNDTPCTLDSLSKLSHYLIDIHSQNQTARLTETQYQFSVIDALAKNEADLKTYSKVLQIYKSLISELITLKQSKSELLKTHEYHEFLARELEDAQLEHINIDALEKEFEALNNVEVIAEILASSHTTLNDESMGVVHQIQQLKSSFGGIVGFGKRYQAIYKRLDSLGIELDDIYSEIDNLNDQLDTDPKALERVNLKLQTINNLLQKHGVLTVEELVAIHNDLKSKISITNNFDESITNLEAKITKNRAALEKLASQIHQKRQKIIPNFIKQLETILDDLGMPNSKFNINLKTTKDFTTNGTDQLEFLVMANKGGTFNTLKKAASGGELSRIMLAVKAILANYVKLPSIIFDEIDTGVSGEIAHKMGSIMAKMSHAMQVITITHLPQIAAKGQSHFKVYKTDSKNGTTTKLKMLLPKERITEIAEMLGGTNHNTSAIEHAKFLLD